MLETCEKCGKRSKNVRKDGSSICYNCKSQVSSEEAKALKEWEETKEEEDDVPAGFGLIEQEISKGGEKMVEDKKVEDNWEVKEVPTQFGVAIVNGKTGEALDIMSAVTKLLNDVEYLKKVLK